MKCFMHMEKDAICMCYACYQGLCQECRINAGYAFACSNECKDRVVATTSYLESIARVNKEMKAGNIKDEGLHIYKQNEKSAATWCLILGVFTAYFLFAFISSMKKTEPSYEYLWFSSIGGVFLTMALSSFRKWRLLGGQREKVSAIVRPDEKKSN